MYIRLLAPHLDPHIIDKTVDLVYRRQYVDKVQSI